MSISTNKAILLNDNNLSRALVAAYNNGSDIENIMKTNDEIQEVNKNAQIHNLKQFSTSFLSNGFNASLYSRSIDLLKRKTFRSNNCLAVINTINAQLISKYIGSQILAQQDNIFKRNLVAGIANIANQLLYNDVGFLSGIKIDCCGK